MGVVVFRDGRDEKHGASLREENGLCFERKLQ
jgi:hypothetical protein